MLSLLGSVSFHRHYYHCEDCGKGTSPWDQIVGLDSKRQTPAAKEIIALGGTIDPFGESADKLIKKMCALRVSESTVQRITESVGAEIGEAQSQGELFGDSKPWKWHKDAEGKTVDRRQLTFPIALTHRFCYRKRVVASIGCYQPQEASDAYDDQSPSKARSR